MNYTEDDLKLAFEYYAFASISQQVCNEKELNSDFKKFIKTLNSDKKLEKKYSTIFNKRR